MNKTKRVAWHKHLKRARKAKEKARALASAATGRAARARVASGPRATPAASRSGTRHTAPRQP